MSDLVTWLRAIWDEDEQENWPRTVVTGPAPNCIGPSGTGDCMTHPPYSWRIDPSAPQADWPALIREHELSHITPRQQFALADIAAKRAILDAYEAAVEFYSRPDLDPYRYPDKETNGLHTAILHIATAYAHRPGYREEWRPA